MSEETQGWAFNIFFSVCVPAWAIWSIWTTVRLNAIKARCDELLNMHNNADEHGFGTKTLTRQSLKLAHWMKASAFWTKWAAEEATGKKAPPIPPDDDDLNEPTLTPPYGDEGI